MKKVILVLSVVVSMVSFAGTVKKGSGRKIAAEIDKVKTAEKIVRTIFGRNQKEAVRSVLQADGSIQVTIGKQEAATYAVKFNKLKAFADEEVEELVDMQIAYLGGN